MATYSAKNNQLGGPLYNVDASGTPYLETSFEYILIKCVGLKTTGTVSSVTFNMYCYYSLDDDFTLETEIRMLNTWDWIGTEITPSDVDTMWSSADSLDTASITTTGWVQYDITGDSLKGFTKLKNDNPDDAFNFTLIIRQTNSPPVGDSIIYSEGNLSDGGTFTDTSKVGLGRTVFSVKGGPSVDDTQKMFIGRTTFEGIDYDENDIMYIEYTYSSGEVEELEVTNVADTDMTTGIRMIEDAYNFCHFLKVNIPELDFGRVPIGIRLDLIAIDTTEDHSLEIGINTDTSWTSASNFTTMQGIYNNTNWYADGYSMNNRFRSEFFGHPDSSDPTIASLYADNFADDVYGGFTITLGIRIKGYSIGAGTKSTAAINPSLGVNDFLGTDSEVDYQTKSDVIIIDTYGSGAIPPSSSRRSMGASVNTIII